MSKDEFELTSVSFRLAPEQIRQLALLGLVYGSRTRAFSVALDRLYQATLAENASFAEYVAENTRPPDTSAEPES